jgi:hypothetical protein
VRYVIPIAAMARAIRAGRAEVLGSRVGDPVYFARAFWQLSDDGSSYGRVDDATSVLACAAVLRRLRVARAVPTGLR